MNAEKQITLARITGWGAIVIGLCLLWFTLPANWIFFGRLWFEDTFEKLLLDVCLVFIGFLLLYIANLLENLKV